MCEFVTKLFYIWVIYWFRSESWLVVDFAFFSLEHHSTIDLLTRTGTGLTVVTKLTNNRWQHRRPSIIVIIVHSTIHTGTPAFNTNIAICMSTVGWYCVGAWGDGDGVLKLTTKTITTALVHQRPLPGNESGIFLVRVLTTMCFFPLKDQSIFRNVCVCVGLGDGVGSPLKSQFLLSWYCYYLFYRYW